MTETERADRLEAMLDRMAEKNANQAEAIQRINAAVDFLLNCGLTSKDQDARAFSNAHALVMIEALRDFRKPVTR